MSEPLPANIPVILERIRGAERICLALDFDAALAAVEGPDRTRLPGATTDTLRRIAGAGHVSAMVLSGRSVAELKRRINLRCVYAGSHGLEIEGEGVSFIHDDAEVFRDAANLACWDLEAALQGIRGVFVERQGVAAAVHYGEAPADLSNWIEATVRLTMRPYVCWLGIKPAARAWEIHPRANWNKASALEAVLGHLGAVGPVLVCAGADPAGEDLFHAVRGAISIQLGGGNGSAARYRAAGLAEFTDFLCELLAAVSSPHQHLTTSAVHPV